MDRRLFLRNAALLTSGIVAADQLDLLERLTHRKNWPGWLATNNGYTTATLLPVGWQTIYTDGMPATLPTIVHGIRAVVLRPGRLTSADMALMQEWAVGAYGVSLA